MCLCVCLCMYSFLCLVFSFPCPLCALCPSCPLVQVFIALLWFSLSCVSVVCVMYSGVQGVVVCCDSVEGVVCVLHVVLCGLCPPELLFCYCMCACAACEKRGFHPAKNIYKKSAIFLKIIVVFLAYMKKKLYLCSVKMKEMHHLAKGQESDINHNYTDCSLTLLHEKIPLGLASGTPRIKR